MFAFIKSLKTKLFRSKWRVAVSIFVLFFIIAYLGSLVFLNTSSVKSKLKHRFHQKTNSDWTIGKILWVPFGDISVNDLHTSMGEGGIQIESITLEPSWGQLFKGSLEVTEATVSKADIDLDLKWLAENSSNIDEIIIEPQPDPTPKPPRQTTQSDKQPASKPEVKTQPNPAPQPEKASPQEIVPIQTPNRWLKIQKMDLTLRYGNKIVENISDLSATIPIAGKPETGELKFKFLGDDYVQKITWDGQIIKAEENRGKFMDVDFQWRAICGIKQMGLPFAFECLIPQQKLNLVLDKPNIHLSITADKVMSHFSLQGGLKNPDSWRGILNVATENTTIIENQKTHKRMNFNQMRFIASLKNGAFHFPVAEAIGHKTSILTNGFIHKNLYSYGTLRIIANHEARDTFERVYRGADLVEENQIPFYFLSPLDTPDRVYCDIFWDGKLTDLEVYHHRSLHWRPVNSLLRKLLKFKNNELHEDNLLEH